MIGFRGLRLETYTDSCLEEEKVSTFGSEPANKDNLPATETRNSAPT